MRYVIGMNPESFVHEVLRILEPTEDWILDADTFFVQEVFNVIIMNTENVECSGWRIYEP